MVREGPVLLLLMLLVGMFTGNRVLGGAAAFVLVLGLLPLRWLHMFFCSHGVFLGLFFLSVAVLAPLGVGEYGLADIIATLFSPVGLVAICGGILSSLMNKQGVDLLKLEPSLVAGVILGSLIAMAFLGGIPVGPVMAAGLASVLIKILRALNIL